MIWQRMSLFCVNYASDATSLRHCTHGFRHKLLGNSLGGRLKLYGLNNCGTYSTQAVVFFVYMMLAPKKETTLGLEYCRHSYCSTGYQSSRQQHQYDGCDTPCCPNGCIWWRRLQLGADCTNISTDREKSKVVTLSLNQEDFLNVR